MMSSLILILLVQLPLSWVFYRCCLVLPAAALGEPMKLSKSWAETNKISGDIIGLVLLITTVTVVGELVGNIISTAGPIFALSFSLVYQWSFLMVSISILTTLYGHIVEGRKLL